MPPCSVSAGTALTAIVAAKVPPGGAISPLAGPPELEDALDAQREQVRTVSSTLDFTFNVRLNGLPLHTHIAGATCKSHAALNLLITC